MSICLVIGSLKKFPSTSSLITILEMSSLDIDTDKATTFPTEVITGGRTTMGVCPANRNSEKFSFVQFPSKNFNIIVYIILKHSPIGKNICLTNVAHI